MIQVQVNGISLPSVPSWQSKEGGAVTADGVKTHPGGMLGEIAIGGPGTRSDATVKCLYTEDFHGFIPQLEAAVGNARMSISWTPLDANRNPSGATQTITGYLKAVNVPNTDANTTAAALLELQMSSDQFQNGAGS